MAFGTRGRVGGKLGKIDSSESERKARVSLSNYRTPFLTSFFFHLVAVSHRAGNILDLPLRRLRYQIWTRAYLQS